MKYSFGVGFLTGMFISVAIFIVVNIKRKKKNSKTLNNKIEKDNNSSAQPIELYAQKLNQCERKIQELNFFHEGLTRFNKIITDNSYNLELLCQKFIVETVESMNALHGVLFLKTPQSLQKNYELQKELIELRNLKSA
ncbi:MAG: hypothetical protein PVF73_07840 [Bacteroidales bacterium]|jgi:hypothetical protein